MQAVAQRKARLGTGENGEKVDEGEQEQRTALKLTAQNFFLSAAQHLVYSSSASAVEGGALTNGVHAHDDFCTVHSAPDAVADAAARARTKNPSADKAKRTNLLRPRRGPAGAGKATAAGDEGGAGSGASSVLVLARASERCDARFAKFAQRTVEVG